MKKFELFAGCFSAESHGIYEFETEEKASAEAYQLAVEDYHSYEGSHGILSFEECCDDARESWGCEDWTEQDFDEFYIQTINDQISYYVEEVFEDEC